MSKAPRRQLPRPQILTERVLETLQHFLHVEAVSSAVLLAAALAALVWANSPFAQSYHDLWHMPLSIGLGPYVFSKSLHFWINDILMTVFFLVVGMEIRREIHEGALSDLKQAALPVAAALGGVIAPALIYLAINREPVLRNGWAVPTATDIAFAVGILGLLGRSIPNNIRVFLLALAIIDDVIAVLIIALLYSGGLSLAGLAVAVVGVLLVLALQRMGIGAAYAYVPPGAVIWAGILMSGAHPTLAGVVLGLMTPVNHIPMRQHPMDIVTRMADELRGLLVARKEPGQLQRPLKQLELARREMLPPVVRVQAALHPWVAYGVMPLFALANAGVSLNEVDLSSNQSRLVMSGVAIALLAGKPVGVMAATYLMVRTGWGKLPDGVSWAGVGLIGLMAGIGFTMSIFIALLAFTDENLLAAAKLGVIAGSVTAACLGLGWGALKVRNSQQRT
jgi:NhaA family Na+:H+ antiporter